MKKILVIISIISLFVPSCDGIDSMVKSFAKDKITISMNDNFLNMNNIELTQPIDSNLSSVVDKMKRKTKLFESDYYIISEFLLKNRNASLSEEVGNVLFLYLKGSKSRNSDFFSFLKKKDISFRDQILVSLVEIMCIDLVDEHYTYEHVIYDFVILKNNAKVRNSFKLCMINLEE